MGFYTPYAVDEHLTPYSNAVKIRQLFVIPNAAEREFFYGVNFEFSYALFPGIVLSLNKSTHEA